MIRKSLKFYIALILISAASVCGGNEINAVLATVNGHPVFLRDILPLTHSAEYQAHAVYRGEELEKQIRELRRKAVDDIIDRRLLLAAYAEKPFTLPPGLVDQRLDEYAAKMGCNSRQNFAAQLRKEKTSVEELRKIITEQLTAELTLYRNIRPEIHVTPQEIYEFYRSNPQRFGSEESFELAMILLDKTLPAEEQQFIARELRTVPGNFSVLAKRYSKGPNAALGGNLGRIGKTMLRKEFAAALQKPEVGRIYGPLNTADGIAFIKLNAHQQANKIPLREAAPKIREELEMQQQQKKIKQYLEKLRSRAIIRIFF